MQKPFLIAAVSALSLSIALPANAVQGATIDQRVKRLERMLENPVLLQLSRRLGEQQRDIQTLQDENDRLKRELRKLKALMDKRYKESDQRLSLLEKGGVTRNTSIDKQQMQSIPKLNEKSPSLDTMPASEDNAVKQETLNKTENTKLVSDSGDLKQTANDKVTSAEKTEVKETKLVLEPKQSSVSTKVVNKGVKVIKTHPATEAEKEAYKAAFSLMRASKYEASIEAFQDFLIKYPNSDLASNAAYWSGEGYLIKDNNQLALDSFMVVIQQYPDSSKVPDAKLRAGDSYDNLGKTIEAQKLYQELIDTRPNSRAAKNAKKRLERL
jgi:tol-pal system protein YbgF